MEKVRHLDDRSEIVSGHAILGHVVDLPERPRSLAVARYWTGEAHAGRFAPGLFISSDVVATWGEYFQTENSVYRLQATDPLSEGVSFEILVGMLGLPGQ
jgi:hypothetical protein